MPGAEVKCPLAPLATAPPLGPADIPVLAGGDALLLGIPVLAGGDALLLGIPALILGIGGGFPVPLPPTPPPPPKPGLTPA